MERSEAFRRNCVLAMNTFGFTVMVAVGIACTSAGSRSWMLAVVHRMTREAAPRIAEELDQEEALAIPGGSE